VANELTATVNVTFNDTGESAPSVTALNINMTGTAVSKGRASIGTSEEALRLGDMTTTANCILVLKNLDSTNFVELRRATGSTKIVRYLPGECWPVRLGSEVTDPYLIADTAPCNVEWALYQR
jgi:hypothetical protein